VWTDQPEQQLKEKRPGMPKNLKRIREQHIIDIPRIPFELELNYWNYPRVTPEDLEWLPLEQTKNQVRKEVKVKQAYS
jgi:hypothetical protein